MPKVSVIIPCYNHGKYIDTAVDSILNQTFQDFEIIIVNDGSTEEFTNNKLDNYNKPKTKVITKQNGGLPAARNTGIENAKGKYICTLDSDDYFACTFLEKAVKILDENETVGIVTSYVQMFEKSNSIWKPKGGGVENFFLNNNSTASCLLKKSIWQEIKGYDEKMIKGYEDWDFNIRVTSKGYNVYVINEILFYYRITDNSMVVGSNKIRSELLKYIIRKNIDVYTKNIENIIIQQDNKISQLNEVISRKDKQISELLKNPVRKVINKIKSIK